MKNKQLEYLLIFIIIILTATCLYLINREQGVVSIPSNTVEYKNTEEEIQYIEIISEELGDVVFNTKPKFEGSGVTVYFDGDAFITELPNWMADYWYSNSDAGMTTFSPRPFNLYKDFSDITILTSTTSETMNAEYLYGIEKNTADVAEIVLGKNGDFRIYHIENIKNGIVFSKYYIDGNGKTGIFTFSADATNYYKYSLKIKEFIYGLSVSGEVRG
jgi:hypothetical protein